MKNHTQRIIFLVLGLIALCVALYFIFDYFVTKKAVTLVPDQGTSITLSNAAKTKKIISTSTPKTIRIKTGTYVIKYSGDEYQNLEEYIRIEGKTSLKTPELSFKTEKLAQMLRAEEAAIHTTVTSLVGGEYQISAENILKQGEWYAAYLLPGSWYDPATKNDINPYSANPYNTKDTLSVILNKENNKWKIAAEPKTTFWIDDYPNIPEDVVRAANKLGF